MNRVNSNFGPWCLVKSLKVDLSFDKSRNGPCGSHFALKVAPVTNFINTLR